MGMGDSMIWRTRVPRWICACILLWSASLSLFPLPVAAAPVLAVNTNGVSFTDPAPGGNNNGSVDAGETIQLTVTLVNSGDATATNVQATLATTTANVTVATASAAYPSIAAGATGSNATAFVLRTSRSFVCGTPIAFTLTVSFTGGSPTPLSFNLATGALGSPVTTSYTGPPVAIPDSPGANVGGTAVTAPLTVTQTGP